ncbi:baculoviral IAP repeat-containing protein 7 isoform X2 [Rhinatrema bivittatum]|uniref:baculoviral IAP repeat-containing protein 7 isoform X2 n=1 Tax=Rhinatrema bivittatum TaxID=194408 RepID=UPI00112AE0E1|nr:baculoviral IAP repeat-containing protein 7 isoform X2 [Rhinatrema bivittatum]
MSRAWKRGQQARWARAPRSHRCCAPRRVVLENARMRSEQRRLRSFGPWPRASPVSAADLARAGFYFLGPSDRVQCFCCGGILRVWGPGDCPLLEHMRTFPRCAFISGEKVGNLPLSPARECADAADWDCFSPLESEEEEEEEAFASRAMHPELDMEQARLATFRTWPSFAKACPEQLATAGFFYGGSALGDCVEGRETAPRGPSTLPAPHFPKCTDIGGRRQGLSALEKDSLPDTCTPGHSDHVTCFYCGGGVKHWEVEDDPLTEHARWFPSCEFLLQAQGREHFNQTQDLPSPGCFPQPAEGDTTSPQDVEDQDLASLLQSSVVQSALQMGFDSTRVENLVQSKYLSCGMTYRTVPDLVSDLVEMEEHSRVEEPQPSMEEQLQRLQEERTCKICMDRDVSIVLVPCGHLVLCGECAPNLQCCPICRAAIRSRVQTFMS